MFLLHVLKEPNAKENSVHLCQFVEYTNINSSSKKIIKYLVRMDVTSEAEGELFHGNDLRVCFLQHYLSFQKLGPDMLLNISKNNLMRGLH